MPVAAPPPSVHPALLWTWIRGWALARETPPPRPFGGGFRVEVGWPEQRARIVFPGLAGVSSVAAAVEEPWVWLKVCAPTADVRPLLPARWTIDRVGYLMERAPAPRPASTLPPGYRMEVLDHGAVLVAEVRAADGAVVAGGRAAVVGDAAVHDRIATDVQHRRRGLARAVMGALGDAAAERGAARGLLVGTSEGRALYTGLGWRLLADYTSAVIRPAG